jgi:hypothetical protein
MIRINLLKNAALKKGTKRAIGFPKWIPVVATTFLCMLLVGAAGVWFLKTKKKPEPPVVIEQKTDFKPSTHVSPNMLEEVVKEVSDERASNQKAGFINLTYDEMSFAEKINYEIFFAKNLLDSLSNIVPVGIGFKTLEIDDFLTMYTVGLGSSLAQVTNTFTLFKDHLGLLPQPYSYIKENETKGYKFIVTCKPNFGVDLINPYQPIEHLFSKDDLSDKLASFTRLAVQHNLRFTSKPVSEHVEKIREFQRFEFEWNCTGTYKDFVLFVNNLYTENLPCAFRSIHIKAKTGNNVEISTSLIFTVKE